MSQVDRCRAKGGRRPGGPLPSKCYRDCPEKANQRSKEEQLRAVALLNCVVMAEFGDKMTTTVGCTGEVEKEL